MSCNSFQWSINKKFIASVQLEFGSFGFVDFFWSCTFRLLDIGFVWFAKFWTCEYELQEPASRRKLAPRVTIIQTSNIFNKIPNFLKKVSILYFRGGKNLRLLDWFPEILMTHFTTRLTHQAGTNFRHQIYHLWNNNRQ